MTVKPEDCLKLTANEEKIVSDMEKAIDVQLRDQFTTATTKVRVTLGIYLNDRVFNKLHTMYSLAGWNVVQKTEGGQDMRGLDPVTNFLEFSKAPRSGFTDDFRDNCGGPYDR